MVRGSTHGGWLIKLTNALANYDGQTGPLPGKIPWPATPRSTLLLDTATPHDRDTETSAAFQAAGRRWWTEHGSSPAPSAWRCSTRWVQTRSPTKRGCPTASRTRYQGPWRQHLPLSPACLRARASRVLARRFSLEQRPPFFVSKTGRAARCKDQSCARTWTAAERPGVTPSCVLARRLRRSGTAGVETSMTIRIALLTIGIWVILASSTVQSFHVPGDAAAPQR
jgi:hypothetical protein